MKVILLDKENFSFFDYKRPLGGAQLAFIELVKSFMRLNILVEVRNNTDNEVFEENLSWRKYIINEKLEADFFIVNRDVKLLELLPKDTCTFLWLHNRAGYLHRWSNLGLLIKYRPTIIFSGRFHSSTFYFHFFFKTKIIPYGRSAVLLEEKSVNILPEKPIAIFTSNPLRSLDWLVDRWKEIVIEVPNAELHIYSGSQTYGSWGQRMDNKMQVPLDYARANASYGIFVYEPLPKKDLITKIKGSRVMLYRGDKAETFCLSIDEALALGVPAVTMDLGSMKERIKDGEFGFVCNSNRDFVNKSVKVLSDEELWLEMNTNLRNENAERNTWENIAQMFLNFA